jgi:hypothetical protein
MCNLTLTETERLLADALIKSSVRRPGASDHRAGQAPAAARGARARACPGGRCL